ncbi:MAG: hypothetical protein RBS56_01705 [Candidatus Gracilibacteria bacterium]|jgi:hypothetical protein|nr:hypothetical protein [Candidatus Gracilibacteria bacterium]
MKKRKFSSVSVILAMVLFFVFLALGIFIKERNFYDRILVEKAFEVFPSSAERSGISFKMVDAIRDEQGQDNIKKMTVRPGDVVERVFLVKNHYLTPQTVSFVSFDVFNSQHSDNPFSVEYSGGDSFVLQPGEWRFGKVLFTIPSDVEVGEYVGKIALRNQDVLKYQKNVDLVLAVANEFYFDVKDSIEENFEHVVYIDSTLTPRGVAMDYVFSDLKGLVGYGFALFSLFFLYKAFVYDRKKK